MKGVLCLAFLLLAISNEALKAQGTAFVYQGSLIQSGSAVNGKYDLVFTLYDSTNIPGNVIAGPLTNSATGVTNGLFVACLDFGPAAFNGDARWLEIAVRSNGVGTFTTLVPRQPLLPVPYAMVANTASNLSGTVSAAQLTGTLPMAQLPGVVLTNGQSGVNLAGNFSGNGIGLTNLNGSLISNVLASALTGIVSPANGGFPNLYVQCMGPGGNFSHYPPSIQDQTPGSGLTVFYSFDLENWSASTLNAAWLITNSVGIRDEDFYDNRANDGFWYSAATYQGTSFGQTNQGFCLFRSTNLFNWQPYGVSNDYTGLVPINLGTSNQIIWKPHLSTTGDGTKVIYFAAQNTSLTPPNSGAVFYATSKDGSWTNLNAPALLATNETGTSYLNDPFLLRNQMYHGVLMDFLYAPEQSSGNTLLIYTNASANFPSQFHLASGNGTSFGIESPCVLVMPDGGYKLMASGGGLPTNSAHPYSWGVYISSSEAKSPLGPWTNYDYLTVSPNTCFPSETILTYSGTNAAYVWDLLKSSELYQAYGGRGGVTNAGGTTGFVDNQGNLYGQNITASGTITANYFGSTSLTGAFGTPALQLGGEQASGIGMLELEPGADGQNWSTTQLHVYPSSPTINGAQISLDSSGLGNNNWNMISASSADVGGPGNFVLSQSNGTQLTLTPAGDLAIAGTLGLASTNTAPADTNTPKAWVTVTVGGASYKLPLYQ